MKYPAINDQSIISISVTDNGEKLVSLLNLDRTFLPSQIKTVTEEIDPATPFVRETVKTLLCKSISLLPRGYGFVLIEGYRSYDYQKELFSRYLSKVKQEAPDLSEFEALEKTSVFISNPDKYSPHITGGALDLAIVDGERNLLDVGNTFEYDSKAQSNCNGLSALQKSNRKLLSEVLGKVGFVNYPYEWWHWSYGDKYWAFLNKTTAIYDSIKWMG